MDNTKISVVTGANGFVGSHLADLLLEKGHKVICLTRKSSNLRWLEDKPVTIENCGLFDTERLKEVLKDANYIFHVAGVVKAKTEKDYYEGNVTTTKNLLDVATEVSGNLEKFVVVSSQTAAGPSPAGKARTEDMEPNPLTRYGKSKAQQEKLAKTYMDKLPITIVRPPAIYGERDTEIYLMFKTYAKGLMTLIGFDDKKLSLIHVEDLVNGIYLAAVSEKSAGETYFIGSEEYYNWPQVSKVFGKALGNKAITLRLPHFLVYSVAGVAEFFSLFSKKAATFNIEKARDFVQKAWTCDTSKAVRELGYRQKVSLEEGMKRTAEWYRENKWL